MKKNILLVVAIVCSTLSGMAQKGPKEERNSPPAKVSAVAAKSIISIDYSQPAVKDRKIWGSLVPYNQVWRAGANEATTFETQKDIKVNGNALPAGKYRFHIIPTEKEWTVIFNKQTESVGSFKYDESQDQLRVVVQPNKVKKLKERLTYYIENQSVILNWEYVELVLQITQ